MSDIPADLGNTHHAGLAAAVAELVADPQNDVKAGMALAQFLYGYVLLDATGSPDGRGFRTLTDDAQGTTTLAVYSSNEAVTAAHPDLGPSQITAMVVDAPEALEMVSALGFDGVTVDHASAAVTFPRELTEMTSSSARNRTLRTALATPPERRHGAVLHALSTSEPGDILYIAVDPASIAGDDFSQARVRTMTNSSGSTVIPVFTSTTEAMLALPGSSYFSQTIEAVRRSGMEPGTTGILLNNATDWDVVTAPELQQLGPRPTPAA